MNMAKTKKAPAKKSKGSYIPEKAQEALRSILEDQELYTFEKDLEGVHPVWKNQRWLTVLRRNYETFRAYNGSNRTYLYWAEDELFVTSKQIEKFGAHLKDKNEKPYIVVNFFPVQKKPGESDEEFKARTRWFKYGMVAHEVFGISKVEGLPEKKVPEEKDNVRIETVEEFLKRIKDCYAVTIEEGGQGTFIAGDTIHIPKLAHFQSSEAYYMTLFKKLILWAGVKSKKFKEEEINKEWSKASLASEMGAAALCHALNISVLPDTQEYVDTWIQKMKEDISILPVATKKAEEVLAVLK
ncbi:MAG TPA: zincin-like metallopeptidase domain-containing protein [Methanofastidiosum sp.]|nr:zincin-like metallopeptidase domain-containing protein [Methanofastidiosum sp.]